MSLRPATRAAGTPYTEGTGLICRIPSRGFSPTRLGLLTQGHLFQFLVRTHGLALTPFSRAPGIRGRLAPYSRIHPLLAITALRGLRRLSELTYRRSTYPDASGAKQGSARCRNINLLPFRVPRLREHLGPTNPRLTSIAEEPWPFRRSGFSPLFAATPPRIHVRTRSTGPHGPTSTRARRPSTRSPRGAPRYRWST